MLMGNVAIADHSILKLREDRAKLVKDAQEILTKHEGKDIPKEEEARFDTMMADADKLGDRIKREERAAAAAGEVDSVIERRSGKEQPGGAGAGAAEDVQEQYKVAFRKWCIGGNEDLSREERAILRNGARALDKDEQRAQTVTTTGGGYTIPQGFSNQIEQSMLDYSGVLTAPTTKMRTDTGNSLPYPTVDDTTNKGALLGINTAESSLDLTYGVVTFAAYKFTSLQVLVPVELMQDSAFNMDSYQIGFQLFMRADGRMLDAGTDPIKYLQHPTA